MQLWVSLRFVVDAAWIKDWGGSVTDELVGDVDFIVLGARPPIPPEPSASQPIEVVAVIGAPSAPALPEPEILAA